MRMIKFYLLGCLVVLLMITGLSGNAQQTDFNIDAYRQFVEENNDISVSGLYDLYPSQVFMDSVPAFEKWEAEYLDQIDEKYNLTSEEIDLLLKNGFVVTERLSTGNFFDQFYSIYKYDLPVFISTDAILHAFHESYDGILKDTERTFLIPLLEKLLLQANLRFKDIYNKYSAVQELEASLKDVDVYLNIACRLLNVDSKIYYPENLATIEMLTDFIREGKIKSLKLFSETIPRKIDFSQFKPRGHYEESEELSTYFRTMMWLGRTEFYFTSPKNTDDDDQDYAQTLKRQSIDAFLIYELFRNQNLKAGYDDFEEMISFFVGEQDNITLDELDKIVSIAGINNADDLLNDEKLRKFRESIFKIPYSGQQILSQLLVSDEMPGSVIPATAFMLFGQRFVVDSYITGQVVYDQIEYMNTYPCRLFPSTLDILFALGNNTTTQILLPDLREYNYSDNLAGLRYLVDQYPVEFWESSLYNMWLYVIRSLNPEPAKENIPEFMKTAAWGLEKMNSQLSSWTELRHDNMLYAKQSYTAIVGCSYPLGFVEPIPEFFSRMKRLAETGDNKFNALGEKFEGFSTYFRYLNRICDTLHGITIKELAGEPFTNQEMNFINRLATGYTLCGSGGAQPVGWYPQLYYEYPKQDILAGDFSVADYHTTPGDCAGNMPGWILHAGTGKVDMIIAVSKDEKNGLVAYAGPVLSYHEYVTTNFLRLSDSEWKESYLSKSLRPEWVKTYLADAFGYMEDPEISLFTDEEAMKQAFGTDYIISVKDRLVVAKNYLNISPNPVSDAAIITVQVPSEIRHADINLNIYDIRGRLVKKIIQQNLPPGNYVSRWDRTGENGNFLPSGIYFLKLEMGIHSETQRIVVVE